MIEITTASTDVELQQILDLQAANLPNVVDSADYASEGFVTARHDLSLLRRMNTPYPHIIAKYEDKVVGYALVMLSKFRKDIPLLEPMFAQIDQQNWAGHTLYALPYVVMGQICVDKNWRGKGMFRQLYTAYAKYLAPRFDYCITGVNADNKRSLLAHQRMGFQKLHRFTDEHGTWHLLLWDWDK